MKQAWLVTLRQWRKWFNAAAGVSLLICVASYVCQMAGWGTPLIVYGPYYGSPHYIYGIVVAGHAWPYAYIFLATCWLPALWILVAFYSWMGRWRWATRPFFGLQRGSGRAR